MQQYHNMIDRVLNEGERVENRTGIDTISVMGHQERFDLREGFPLVTTKKVHTKSIFWELIWFLKGLTDVKWLQERKVTIWDEWATAEQCGRFGRCEGDLGPIYGHQWRHFGATIGDSGIPINGTDQIFKLFYDLVNDTMSRRIIVTGWNPAEANTVALPPCHTLWQVKAYPREDGGYWLDLHLYQRSCDLFLGVPFNIASYAALTHLICHLSPVDLKPRHFIHTLSDLHIYENHLDQIKLQRSREPFPLPTLGISPGWAGLGIQAIDGVYDHPDFEQGAFIQCEDFVVMNYKCHPGIKGQVAV